MKGWTNTNINIRKKVANIINNNSSKNESVYGHESSDYVLPQLDKQIRVGKMKLQHQYSNKTQTRSNLYTNSQHNSICGAGGNENDSKEEYQFNAISS